MNKKRFEQNNCADLHVHTAFSDGVLSPDEVVSKALELGLKAIAITDHDCVDGVGPSILAAEGTDLQIIPGIEISASREETEIHVLGYFIDYRESELVRVLVKMRANRIDRMHKILDNLRGQGVNVNEARLFENASSGTLGRLHLARVLVEEKIVRSTKEAFDKYLGDGKCCHVRHERLDYTRCMELIRNAGGVPVLAHPGTMGRDEYIPGYVKAGLKGIEVYHTKHHPAANKKYSSLAREHELLETGGSDCHGIPTYSGEMMMGKITVSYSVVDQLRVEAERIQGQKGETAN